jgi:hypothetical protein
VQAIDGTARVMIHGRAIIPGQTDIRQRYDQFIGGAQAPDAIPANAEVLPDRGIRLKATNTLGPNSTIVTSGATYYRDKAALGAEPFIDPIQPDASTIKQRLVALVQWGGSRSTPMELTQVQAWLHPHFDTTKPKSVAQWRLDLYNIQTVATIGFGSSTTIWQLQPICTAFAPAVGDAAGWVSFAFPNAARPRPKAWPPPVGQFGGSPAVLLSGAFPATVAVVTGLAANGSPASNIGWGYDSGHTSTTTALDVLSGLLIKWLPATPVGPSGPGFPQQFAGSPGWIVDVAASGTVPAIQFSYAQYTTATIAFTTRPINLGSVPASPPELALHSEVPVGCALTGTVSADNVNFYAFTDGQTVDTVGPGLPTQQTYYVTAVLTPNGTADATPILGGIGADVAAITDLSNVAEVASVAWVVDPVKLKPEVPELTLTALHDGERDFRDAITTFLSQSALANLMIRVFIGDTKLPRSQWLHKDDFLIDDVIFEADHARLTGIHPSSLLKQALPVSTPEVAATPLADSSNPGAWTASAGTVLANQIADGGGSPDDTTFIASPNNPVNAAYTATLTGIGTPTLPGGAAQLVGIEVQVRAAMASGVGPITLSVSLLEGATQRALRSSVINSTVVTQPVFRLTSAEITSIGNWSNLLLKLSANGTGTVNVTWGRLVQLGMRPALSYANTAIGTVAQDLIANQLALDGRYRGDPLVDTSPALTVSKTIQAAGGGSTDLGQAKAELDAVAWIMGSAFLPEQGKIRCRRFFDITPQAGNLVVFTPRADGPVALFPADGITPLMITPGYRQRVPEFFINWGYNTDGTWQGEAKGYFGPAFTSFADARVDADPRLDAATAQWFADQFLAGGVATRHVNCFGMGLLLWRFRSDVRHPELSLGDLVSLETDRFAAYDPVSLRPIAGKLWATGFVVGIYDVWGSDLALWIPTWANLVPVANQTPVSQPPPTPQAVGLTRIDPFWRANELWVNWQGGLTVASVKIATSNSAYPAAGTGTATDGQNGLADGGAWVYGDVVYGTITPYAGPAGTGLQGTAVQFRMQLGSAAGMFDPGTGKPMRTQVYPDGKYALAAADSAGATAQDAAAKMLVDVGNALITVTDAQGTPKVRAKYGKVGAGTSDYGLQVYDQAGATVADFTGAKRILAVPVQPSVDSGTAVTLDLSTGLTQQVRLTGTATVTLSNPTDGSRYRIWFQQDPTGSRPFPTITGANGDEVVMYTNDIPPTLTTTPGALDLFEFEYRISPSKRFTCMTLQLNVLLPTPQVQSITGSQFNVAATSHLVSMPATVNAGDLLLCFIDVSTGTVTTPTGWTLVTSGAHGGGAGSFLCYAKAAAGTEGGTTVDFVTSANATAAAQVYRITRWNGSVGSGILAGFTTGGGASVNPDPPLLTGFLDRDLWIAAEGTLGAPTISAYPASYTNGTQSLGTGNQVASARRVLYAASENPGAFTISGAQVWGAITVCVEPPA